MRLKFFILSFNILHRRPVFLWNVRSIHANERRQEQELQAALIISDS
jgi:hypothetical protein